MNWSSAITGALRRAGGFLVVIGVIVATPPLHAAPTDVAEAPEELGVTVLVVEGEVDEELRAAMTIRLAGRLVRFAAEPRLGVEGARAYVAISELRPRWTRLELILEDGRAFVREFEMDADGSQRLLAASLANLLSGIESGETRPDRVETDLPEALAKGEDAEASAIRGQSLGQSADGERPEPSGGDDRADPEADRPLREPPEGPAATPPISQRKMMVGGAVELSGMLGLSPSPGFRAGFGALQFELLWAGSGILSVGSGFGMVGDSSLRILRSRTHLAGGWRFARETFELPLLVVASLEPWWVRVDRATVSVKSQSAGQLPLLGLGLECEPRWVLGSAGQESSSLFLIGVPIRVSASGIAGSGRGAEIRPAGAADPRHALGGLEASLGVRVGIRRGQARSRKKSRGSV